MLKENIGTTDQISIQIIRGEPQVRKLIAVGGQPGTGKTTLFRKFIEGKNCIQVEPAKLVSALYNRFVAGYLAFVFQSLNVVLYLITSL